MAALGWPIEKWVSEGKWEFIDASPDVEQTQIQSGSYDLAALLIQIEHAITVSGAKRVAMDSLGAIFNQFSDANVIRRELLRISRILRKLNVTTLVTAERLEEYGQISRHGVEEFVADNVVILRNVLEDEKCRRTLQVLKFRGTNHQKGEWPFTIVPDKGIVVIPLSSNELKQKSSNIRVSAGNDRINEMCGGGYFRDSIVLVSGASGCGKTLMSAEFVAGGVENGERCVLFAFEESRDQLMRNATGWGKGF